MTCFKKQVARKVREMQRSLFQRTGAIALSLLIAVALLPISPQQAAAVDPEKGIEVAVDSSSLDAAVTAAKADGVTVTQDADVDKGSATSQAELDAKKAEITEDYNSQIEALKAAAQEARQKLAEYATKKAAYDTALAQYNTDKAQYDFDLAQYNTDLAAYNAAMEELERKKNEDGYMTKPYPQLLTFKSEPNATLTVSGKKYTRGEFSSEVRSWNLGTEPWRYAYFDALNNGQPNSAARVMLEKDKPFVATYTNLTNSSYNGKKISKVEYTYTYKGSSGVNVPDKLPVVLQQDPTVTIWYNDFFGDARINMKVKFYDEDGNVIDPTGSLLNFSSLNRGNGSGVVDKDAIEKVAYFNGEYVPISGSSISAHADGSAYSDTNNAERAKGAKFNTDEWDTPDSPNAWYGAIVGRVIGPEISLDMASHKRGVVWFALNSKIKAIAAPPKPVEPTPPTPPTEPVKPVITASYHYDVLYVKPQVEKKVLDQDNKDIDTNTVKTGSIVKFELTTTPFPAGHETIDSVIFRDTLPEGYELDLEATKSASPDYDVEYDEASRSLVFTGKDALITQINADRTKEAAVPAPMVVGKVTKEGTTYENQFDLDINHTYSVKSNTVKVSTPEKPSVSPKTGDDTVLIPITLMVLSAAALGARRVITRKNQSF